MNSLDTQVSYEAPYAGFADQLRELRRTSGQSYRTLSENTGYSRSTLAAAVTGNSLPSEQVMLAFVRACGGDEREWRARWSEARLTVQSKQRSPFPSTVTPEPPGKADLASVATPADLTAMLNRLWAASGRITIRQLAARSGGSLRKTAVHDVLTGARIKPTWSTVWELVRAMHGPDEEPDEASWHAAWKKARNWAEFEGRRPRRTEPPRTPVRSCDPVTLGAHPALIAAAGQPAFIERDIGCDVRAAIAAAREHGGFILLIGEEGSGKTRLAYEALRAEVPEFGLFSPASEEDLRGPLPPRTVVWLDNISNYLSWASLTPVAMQSLISSPGRVIIVGTMDSKRYNHSSALTGSRSEEDHQRHRETLNQATVYPVSCRLTHAEQLRAQQQRSDKQIATALEVTPHELFRTLASGRHLTRRWSMADPYAKALITAAADSRRVGVDGPMPPHLLRTAAACYLSARDREQDSHDWFDDALAYATAPVPGGLAPLMMDSSETGQPGSAYRPAEYLLWLRETTEHQELVAAGELADNLVSRGFENSAYRAFERDLIQYAVSVLSRWPESASPPTTSHYAGRHRYPEDHDDALRLAMETVHEVLPDFRCRLAAGSWESGTGDSPAARFIAMCRNAIHTAGDRRRHTGSIEGPQCGFRGQDATSSPQDGSTLLRIILGTHLRRLRATADITLEHAAAAIHIPESGLDRIERGQGPAREIDVLKLLALYAADTSQQKELLALTGHAARSIWWARYHDVLPEWFQAYADLEQVATFIRIYEQQFIPGLLQTTEYASAVLSLCDFPAPEAEQHVEFRAVRQQRLRKGQLTVWALIDEAVLRRTIAGEDVQIQQLRHLIQLQETCPRLTLQIIRYDARAYPVPNGFSILRFADGDLPEVVYVEHLTSALYLDKRADTEHYRLAMERLTKVASAPEETTRLLEKAIRNIAGSASNSN